MSVPLFKIGFSMLWALMLAGLTGELFAAVLGLSALLGAMIALGSRDDRTVSYVLASVFFACALFCLKTELHQKPAQKYAGTRQTMTGRIIEIEPRSDAGTNRYIVKVTKGELKGRKLRLSSKFFEGNINDEITFSGKIYAMDRKSRDIYIGVFPYGKIKTEPGDGGLLGFVRQKAYDTRQFMRNELFRSLPSDCSLTLFGMLSGDKSEMPDYIYDNFKRTGVVHLLAVSGFHTSLWSMMVYRSLLKRGANVKVSAFFAILFILFFMAVTGFTKSAVRAGIMVIIFFLGRMIMRQPDSKNSLGLAAIIILSANPFAGGDTGFLLSFFSTLGILVLFPYMQEKVRPKVKKYVKNFHIRRRVDDAVSVVLVTVSTLIFTLPVTALVLGNLSLVSPPANLLVTPVTSFAIILSGFAVTLAKIPVLRAFEHPCLLVAALIIRYVLKITSLISGLSFASVSINSGYFLVGVAAALILIGSALILKADKRRTAALSCLLPAASVAAHYIVQYIELHN
ncbi:MAG: ComEC/Rec2 family competence protein [Clostridia bacterium]|nr:ComEC/Rec2 family competence protein [Clostridia bacterium]